MLGMGLAIRAESLDNLGHFHRVLGILGYL
jgi:hypothetical protein